MADKKISQLTGASTPLAGTEVLPIVQSGSTVKVAVSNLTAGRSVSAGSVDSAGDVSVGTSNAGLTQLVLTTTGEAADQKNWRFQTGTGIGTGVLRLRAINDAGSSGQNAWVVSRTADNIDSQSFLTGGSNRLSIGATDVTVNTGNLVVGTAAKGIDFSANTHAAGMTSELLNWYEEGTWTPSLGGDTTYLAQSGIYTRVGRLVWASCVVYVNVLGTGSVDTISGLPFAKNASGGSANCSVPQFSDIATNVYSLSATMASTSIVLKGMTAIGATNQGALTVFKNGTYLEIQCVYSV